MHFVMNRSLVAGVDLELDRWRAYPPMSWSVSILMAIIMSVIMVAGTFGNILVIVLFAKYKSLRTTPNILVVNMTIADLLMCVICFPILISNCIKGHMINELLVFRCYSYAFISAVTGFVSILSLTTMATDRCIVIIRSVPMTFPRDKVAVYTVIVAMWLICGSVASMPLLGFGRYVMEGSRLSCTFDFFTQTRSNLAFNIIIQLVFFMIPIFIICVCYLCIYVKVRVHEQKYFRKRNSKNFDEIALRRIRRSRKFEKSEVKTARAAMILILVFCISWLPYSIVSWIGLFGDSSGVSPIIVAIPGIFAKSSTVLNPVLYALLHRSFQRKFLLLYNQFCNKTRNSSSLEHAQHHHHDTSNGCSVFLRKPSVSPPGTNLALL